MSTQTTVSSGAPRRRKSSKDRWSASSTVEWVDRNNVTVARTPDAHSAPAIAVKAKVHYRYEGRPKKRIFKGVDMIADVRRFQTFLAAGADRRRLDAHLCRPVDEGIAR